MRWFLGLAYFSVVGNLIIAVMAVTNQDSSKALRHAAAALSIFIITFAIHLKIKAKENDQTAQTRK